MATISKKLKGEIQKFFPNLTGRSLRKLLMQNQQLLVEFNKRVNVHSYPVFSYETNKINLQNAQLPGVDLRHESLGDFDLREANLREAKLTGANLSGANLGGANLSGANLEGADLSGANLEGADLSGANLTGANLTGAKLTGACLNRTKLGATNLTGTDIEGVIDFTGAPKVAKQHLCITEQAIKAGSFSHEKEQAILEKIQEIQNLINSGR
jgi:uncharacterized protein YjbI with pentapeptide repeats